MIMLWVRLTTSRGLEAVKAYYHICLDDMELVVTIFINVAYRYIAGSFIAEPCNKVPK